MKRIISIITLLLFCFALPIVAQKLKVESFKPLQGDVTALSESECVLDGNGVKCALIKVGIALDGVQFGGGNVIKVKKKVGEYWVFVPQKTTQLEVSHPNYTPLRIDFFEYPEVQRAKSATTYELTLVKPSGGAASEPVDVGGNFYALTVQPANAKVSIDGTLQEAASDGQYSAMLPYGSHRYTVEAGGYISQSGTFTVSQGNMQPIQVSLVSAQATVSVKCPTPAVSLYVDRKRVGTLPWTGSLKEGMHLLEAKREGYRAQQRTIQLSQQQRLEVSFDEMSAIQGNLSVNYKPFGADVYLDGTKLGQSPRVFSGLLVGSHKVEVKKEGYLTDSKTVTIVEGQTTSLSGALSSQSSSSSSSLGTLVIPVNGVNIEMVKVEAGTFQMGATSEMQNPWDDEKPVHQVTLTHDYYIGKYEVTQALWQAVMGKNPSSFKGDNLPVENVSWDDCQEFIKKINSLTHRTFRLPTESEWEYAARGGKKSQGYQYSGSNNLDDVAWYESNSGSKTHAVGTKLPNELGLYDMSGNVWEWCQDWKGTYPSYSVTNPTGAKSGSYRVRRGGSWFSSPWYCRASYRGYLTPDISNGDLGLRLVLSSVE